MRQHGPRRQQRTPRPELWLSDSPALVSLALALWRRVRQARYARQTGTVVAVDDMGGVYLMCAELPATEQFIAQHPNWIVGTYATEQQNTKLRVPTVDMILDDLMAALPVD